MNETSKCYEERKKEGHFESYLKGKGIDIGCGEDRLKIHQGEVHSWDLSNGDAMDMNGIKNETYDFVYSSHCLEHLKDIEISLFNWSRIIKKDGYLYFVVPEYVLYEGIKFPSIHNYDHKQTFSYYITKEQVKRDNHYHRAEIVKIIENLNMEVIAVKLEDENYDYNKGNYGSQTLGNAKAQILFIAKKKKETPVSQMGADDWFVLAENNTKTKKIGLCMIVKNESKIIERCLDSVKPMIDYVCVADTGSTDSTIEVINSWLIKNNMAGQVVSEPWKNFAHNRSFALAKLREQKDIDYALMIDADEILTYEDGFNIAEAKRNMKHDLYNINCKLGGSEYVRTTITKNNMPYYYRGVVHEFLDCREPIKTREMFNGICNIPLQDSARNENTQKFQNDARLLEDTLKTEADPFLISRYTFYLAQSYKDCGEQEKAIYWYNERAKQGFYNQEVYISLYKVAKLKEERAYPGDDIIQSYMRAYEICPGRIEALHDAISYCRRNGRNHQAFMMASYARSMPANRTGLFSQNWMWDYGIDDEYSITAYWTGHASEGIKVTEKLLKKIPEQQKPRILKNLEYLKAKLTS